MAGANPSWHGPWESALSGNFRKGKTNGHILPRERRKQKSAAENRTGKRPPSTGMPQALWQPAHMQGTAGLGSPLSRGTKTCGPCRPRTHAHQRSRGGQEDPGRRGDCRCRCRNPARRLCCQLSPRPHHRQRCRQCQPGQTSSWSVTAFWTPGRRVLATWVPHNSKKRPHLHPLCKFLGCV